MAWRHAGNPSIESDSMSGGPTHLPQGRAVGLGVQPSGILSDSCGPHLPGGFSSASCGAYQSGGFPPRQCDPSLLAQGPGRSGLIDRDFERRNPRTPPSEINTIQPKEEGTKNEAEYFKERLKLEPSSLSREVVNSTQRLNPESTGKAGYFLVVLNVRKNTPSPSSAQISKLQNLFAGKFRMFVELMVNPTLDQMLDKFTEIRRHQCMFLYLVGPGDDLKLLLSDNEVLDIEHDLVTAFSVKKFSDIPKYVICHAIKRELPQYWVDDESPTLSSCKETAVYYTTETDVDISFLEHFVEEFGNMEAEKPISDAISQLMSRLLKENCQSISRRPILLCNTKWKPASCDEKGILVVSGRDRNGFVPSEVLSIDKTEFLKAPYVSNDDPAMQIIAKDSLYDSGYVYGFANFEESNAALLRMRMSDGVVSPFKRHPMSRTGLAATCVPDEKESSWLYTSGGLHYDDFKHNHVWRLWLGGEDYPKWEDVPNMKSKRSHHSMVYVEHNKHRLLVVAGGLGNDCNSSCEILDLDNPDAEWRTPETQLNCPRHGHCSASFDGRVYIVGGVSSEDGNVTNQVESWDPTVANSSWEPMEPMTTARSNFALVVYDERLYAIGGFDNEDNILKSTEYLDLKVERSQQSWIEGPSLVCERAFTTAVVLPYGEP